MAVAEPHGRSEAPWQGQSPMARANPHGRGIAPWQGQSPMAGAEPHGRTKDTFGLKMSMVSLIRPIITVPQSYCFYCS